MRMFAATDLEEALELLGQLLFDRGQTFEVVAIGGGGLLLIGVIDRPTRDLDLVAFLEGDTLVAVENALPVALSDAVADVARVLNLPTNWMNGGPTSLLRFGLPEGFRYRLQRRAYGGLGVSLASRFDQIHFKLYAAADDKPLGKHHADLKQLKPTRDELVAAARWAMTHDPSEGFRLILSGVLKAFDMADDF
jgi:hypothetical protein